jgi:RNA polymerase sigma-70 factor (ECF subfamily)
MSELDPDLGNDDSAVSCSAQRTTGREFARLSSAARGGCVESLGHLVESCRKYLLLVANRSLDRDLRVKMGASDLVQDTLLAAQRGFVRFEGSTDRELRLWLRRILLNRICSAQRTYFRTAKRQVSRERPLSGQADSDVLQQPLIDPELTPRCRALADEQSQQIERELSRLPAHYRAVIELRCFERRSFIETGRILQISTDAARKRWCRAIERLRQQLETNDDSRQG